MGGDLGDPVPQRVVVAGDGGGGELGCKPALQRIRVVAKADPANAARGRRDEQPAEGARDDCERDARPRAAAAIRGRGHAQLRVGALVYAAGGTVAGFIESGAHLLSPFQLDLEAVEPALVPVLAGGRPSTARKARSRRGGGVAARSPSAAGLGGAAG